MIAADRCTPPPRLDEPWRRLPWLTPSALLVWAVLLLGFALLLQSAARPPESIERLDARLLDVPASSAPGGLQDEPGAEPQAPAPAVAPVPPPQPQVERKPQPAPAPRPKERKPAPPTVYDAHGPHTAPPVAIEGAPTDQPPADGGSVAVGSTASGRPGAGGGLGTDSIGARAIYAPVPKIPDDLREDVFHTVAVAHFQVTFNGTATVSLVQPTTNLRLNSILLDTLQQWRFFPAIRNGVAIDSAFDVRIPIVVQ